VELASCSILQNQQLLFAHRCIGRLQIALHTASVS
jgi:hypothetical protein